MNRHGIKKYLLVFIVCLSVFLSIKAWGQAPHAPSQLFSESELDQLLAPIALYPDPLLAQMLPASTYPGEIVDAYNWLTRGGPSSEIDRQNWAESVRAIAHYPDVLKMMAENAEWTADLGDAFLNQPDDVTRSIQRLRWQARNLGNLRSNSKQTVIITGNYIEIIPAQPQYMYVPFYDPSVVYVNSWYPGVPYFVTFGFGLLIGGWLIMDFDWPHHHIIYHGWRHPGWVNRARPYIHVSNVYVNRSRPYINSAWKHDPSHGNPERFRARHPGISRDIRNPHLPEIRGKAVTPSRPLPGTFGPKGDTRPFSNRGKESRGAVSPRPKPPSSELQRKAAPGTGQRPAARTPRVIPRPEMPGPDGGKITPQPRTAPRTPRVIPQPGVTAPEAGKIVPTPRTAPRTPGVIPRPGTPRPDVGKIAPQPRPAPRTPQVVPQPGISTPGTGRITPQPGPARGSIEVPRTPSTFGGYRGAGEARGQSLRGQSSRESAVSRGSFPAPSPSPSPAPGPGRR
ncbi:MAG: DUF3300 domain-containing protein [Smithella sp.]